MERKQVKWIDIEKEQPTKNQYILYLSKEDVDKFHYDDPRSKWWEHDFGLTTGNYCKDDFVEYDYDAPMVKIKYWSPAPRFEWDIY